MPTTTEILEACSVIAADIAPELPPVIFFDEWRPGCFGWVDEADQIGPEPRVGLNLHDIASAVSAPDQFVGCCYQVAIHELGHVLESPRGEASYCSATVDLFEDGDSHDAGFARRTLHAWWRAVIRGWEISLPQLIMSPCFHLPSEERLLPTLCAELYRFADASFGEIESVPPPAGFIELWQAGLDARKLWQDYEGARAR